MDEELTDEERRLKEDDFTHYYNATIRLNAKVATLTMALQNISNFELDINDPVGVLPLAFNMRGIARRALGKDVS